MELSWYKWEKKQKSCLARSWGRWTLWRRIGKEQEYFRRQLYAGLWNGCLFSWALRRGNSQDPAFINHSPVIFPVCPSGISHSSEQAPLWYAFLKKKKHPDRGLKCLLEIHSGYTQYQFSSVAHSCPTLCDPVDCSTPGLPVHHQFPEFTQTHVHWVGDAIQPSHPLSSPSPPAFKSFPESGSFQMSQLFESGGQSIGVSASTSVLPVNTQDWSPLGWTGWISLQWPHLRHIKQFSNTVQEDGAFTGWAEYRDSFDSSIFRYKLICRYCG